MTILDTIVAHKRHEVNRLKEAVSVGQLERSPLFQRQCYSASLFIRRADKSGIIAEFKRASPSKGTINDQVSVREVTTGYAQAGVSCLSVLTDKRFFGGSTNDLQEAREYNAIPILRKDFVIDEYQIVEAKAMGADMILLIAECLSAAEVRTFATLARSLGMEVLMELNQLEEVEKICPELNLVGVNNRDLRTFTVDINQSVEIGRYIPREFVKVSESGLSNPEDVQKLRKHGFEAFLMGEAFMKTTNPAISCAQFIKDAELIKTGCV